MIIRLFLIFPSLVLAGCSHLFVQSNTTLVQNDSKSRISVICIRKGDYLQHSQIISLDDDWYGKSYAKMLNKLHNVKVDCSSQEAFNFLINFSEKEQLGIYWFFTLGVIPGVYKNNLNIKVFDLEKNTIFERNITGNNVISILFVPLFFFKDDIDKIAFDEIEKYLVEQEKP